MTILRLAALIIASTAAGLWLFLIILQVVVGLQKGQEVLTLESGLLMVLILVNVAGVLLGWWRRAAGTKLLLAGGPILSIFSFVAAGWNRSLVFTISGLPFLLAGTILWYTGRSDTNQRTDV
jgi:hypothetical protein